MTEFTLLKKYAHGEVDVNVVEIGERILSGEATNFDLAFFRLATSSDRREMWERYMKRWQRVLGPLFAHANWDRYEPLSFCCRYDNGQCMELAVGDVCYLHDVY